MAWASQKGYCEPCLAEITEGLSDPINWVVDNAGSVACKTDLETKVEIVDSYGSNITWETVSNDTQSIPTWLGVPSGSQINYEIKTLADDKKGASDRVTLEITALDPTYIIRVSSSIIGLLTDEQMVAILAGDDTIIDTILQENPKLIDPELAIVSFYSDTIVTDDNGFASGSIPINPAWGESEFQITFHYGYMSLSEMSTEDKTTRIWVEEIGPMIAEILLTVALVAISGGCALAVRLGYMAKMTQAAVATSRAMAIINTAARLAGAFEMAMMAKQFLIDGFGIIGTNRHGCSFPLLGFNHVYAFDNGYEKTLLDEAGNIDFSSLDINSIESLIQKNLVRNIIIGSVVMGLLGFLVFGKW